MSTKLWKACRDFLGRRFFGFTKYHTYENINPQRPFGKIDGFDTKLADEIKKELIERFGMNGTPPPSPQPNETVDQWMGRLERWFFHNNITELEAEATLGNGDSGW